MVRAGDVIILQHVANETSGTIGDYLLSEKIQNRTVRLYAGEDLPSTTRGLRAVVIMGGPMNVYEEDKYPFLANENRFILLCIEQNVPVLGICLGSQLIAKALGAKVYKAKAPEIGWGTVRLNAEAKKDKLFSSIAAPSVKVLQWHEDTFDIPLGAALLASSDIVPHQAFRYRDRFYGFQFHVEVDRTMLSDWFKDSSMRDSVLAEQERYRSDLSRISDEIYGNFFRLI